jgi:hypothetical protein
MDAAAVHAVPAVPGRDAVARVRQVIVFAPTRHHVEMLQMVLSKVRARLL